MNVLNFAKEFSRLVNRYTRTSSPNNDVSNAIMPLTEEQIVTTIHHVLLVLMRKDFDDKNNNLLQILNSASGVTTPETSVIQMKHEPNENMHRSQDVQSVITDEESSLSDISLKGIKKEQENSFSTLQNDKKFISRSNPAICVSNISRSDTFVREEKNQKDTDDNEDVFKDTDVEINSSDPSQVSSNEKSDISSNFVHVSLKEIRKSVMDIIAKLNHLEQLLPQPRSYAERSTKKIQNSTLFSNCSPDCVIIKNKTTVNNRKSSTASFKTPTSSKLYITEKKNTFERRKSTGAIGTNATPVRKSTKVGHSISNINISPYKAAPSSEYRPKFTKNPKYAHVRSTIPKAISQKKKTQ